MAWTWSLPAEKLVRILHELNHFLSVNSITQHHVWSLVGKLFHIRPLIPEGKFNFHHLLEANQHSENRDSEVPLSPACKRQLFFWFSMICLCSGNGPIPNPDSFLPPWAINVYTDAAGGSTDRCGLGVGAVTDSWWAFVPWSRAINHERKTSGGRNLNQAMSALDDDYAPACSR